jgi:CheY-like chemotaxis protein
MPPAKPAVLVADDDPELLRFLDELLSTNGFSVVTAIDGADAVEKFRTRPFQILVTDLAMPKLNGLHVAKRCKALSPAVKIVLLTAWDLLVDEEDRVESGIDRVVPKPARSEQFLTVLRELSPPPA